MRWVLLALLASGCSMRAVAVTSIAADGDSVWLQTKTNAAYYQDGHRVFVDRLAVIRCEEKEESEGVFLTECRQVVSGGELIPWLSQKTLKGAAVFRHPVEPVHVEPEQWKE